MRGRRVRGHGACGPGCTDRSLGWAFVKMLRLPKTKWMDFAGLRLLTYYRVNAMTLETTMGVRFKSIFCLFLGVLVALAPKLAAVVGGRL